MDTKTIFIYGRVTEFVKNKLITHERLLRTINVWVKAQIDKDWMYAIEPKGSRYEIQRQCREIQGIKWFLKKVVALQRFD